jgi:hypothetical protein
MARRGSRGRSDGESTPPRGRAPRAEARRPGGDGAGSLVPLGHGDLGESLLFVFPLFLVYGVGLMFASTVNGVDFISRLLFAAVGHDRGRYLFVHLVLAAIFLVVVLVLRRTSTFRLRVALPMVLESAIYALTLGTFIVFVMDRVLGRVLAIPSLDVPAVELPALAQNLLLAVGAGVHEELVFRLGLVSGGAFLLERLGARRGLAVLVAALASSLAFAAAHHLGPHGDPWDLDVFAYRAIAGCIFAAIYWFRSLAHAVYAHCLYDVYVMLARAA